MYHSAVRLVHNNKLGFNSYEILPQNKYTSTTLSQDPAALSKTGFVSLVPSSELSKWI